MDPTPHSLDIMVSVNNVDSVCRQRVCCLLAGDAVVQNS